MRGGRAVVVEQSDKVKPWRQAVVSAVMEVRASDSAQLDGPLNVAITFYMPRPKSVPKSRTFPSVKPDLDKLIRSTLDGLTDSGLWHDDAQVTHLIATKQYASGELDRAPGALIAVSQVS